MVENINTFTKLISPEKLKDLTNKSPQKLEINNITGFEITPLGFDSLNKNLNNLKKFPLGTSLNNLSILEQNSNCPTFEEIRNGAELKLGANGDTVIKLQQRLNKLGFKTPITGSFDKDTEKALKDFQKTYNITETGILGKTTLAALEKVENDPYNLNLGNKIAKKAKTIATKRDTIGQCYNAVAEVLESILGQFLGGMSAYEASKYLAKNPNFKEIKVKPSDLKNLKPGSVVVWGKSPKSPHGHISIALGNGKEASDHIQDQLTHLRGYTNFRVFIPVKVNR